MEENVLKGFTLSEYNYLYMLECLQLEDEMDCFNLVSEHQLIIQEKLDIKKSLENIKNGIVKFIKYVFERVKRFVIYYKNFIGRITKLDKLFMKAKYDKCMKILKENPDLKLPTYLYEDISKENFRKIVDAMKDKKKETWLDSLGSALESLNADRFLSLLYSSALPAAAKYGMGVSHSKKSLESYIKTVKELIAKHNRNGFYSTLDIKYLGGITNEEEAIEIIRKHIFNTQQRPVSLEINPNNLKSLLDDYDIVKDCTKMIERSVYDINNQMEGFLRTESKILKILESVPKLDKDVVEYITLYSKLNLAIVGDYRILMNGIMGLCTEKIRDINQVFNRILSEYAKSKDEEKPQEVDNSVKLLAQLA